MELDWIYFFYIRHTFSAIKSKFWKFIFKSRDINWNQYIIIPTPNHLFWKMLTTFTGIEPVPLNCRLVILIAKLETPAFFDLTVSKRRNLVWDWVSLKNRSCLLIKFTKISTIRSFIFRKLDVSNSDSELVTQLCNWLP